MWVGQGRASKECACACVLWWLAGWEAGREGERVVGLVVQ